MVFEEIIYSDMLPYAAGFLLLFLGTFYLTNRSIFKDNRQMATMISLCIAALALWGIVTQTDLFYSFSSIFDNLGDSISLILLIGIAVVIIIFLKKGLWKLLSSNRINWIILAPGLILLFVSFFPQLISPYYLPDWFTRFYYFFPWVGGALVLWAFIDSMKWRRSKLKTEDQEFVRRK